MPYGDSGQNEVAASCHVIGYNPARILLADDFEGKESFAFIYFFFHPVFE